MGLTYLSIFSSRERFRVGRAMDTVSGNGRPCLIYDALSNKAEHPSDFDARLPPAPSIARGQSCRNNSARCLERDNLRPSGARDYRTDHLLCIMTPRPFPLGPIESRSSAHPSPKVRIPAHTHAPPPPTTDVSRSAITIISVYDGRAAARTDIFRPRCT